jgi:hypothetical protein
MPLFIGLSLRFIIVDLPVLKGIRQQKQAADYAFECKNYFDAREIYIDLFKKYPKFSNVKFQLIKSCFALGDRSVDYINEAFGYFSEDMLMSDVVKFRMFVPERYREAFDEVINSEDN